MKTIRIETEETVASPPTDFALAKRLADAVAGAVLGEPLCLSWYDREADRTSPSLICAGHDFKDYAIHRGGELIVLVAGEAYQFCYRSIGDLDTGDE